MLDADRDMKILASVLPSVDASNIQGPRYENRRELEIMGDKAQNQS